MQVDEAQLQSYIWHPKELVGVWRDSGRHQCLAQKAGERAPSALAQRN